MIRVIWPINNRYNKKIGVIEGFLLIRSGVRYSVGFLIMVMAGAALPVGLGEIRGQPVIGEELNLQLGLLGGENRALDVSCFRLVKPVGIDDQTWLKSATLTLRGRADPILEIRSRAVLREPILNLAVYLGCGFEIERSYTLLVSPAPEGLRRLDVPREIESLSGLAGSAQEPVVRRSSRPRAGSSETTPRRPSAGLRMQPAGRYELRLSTEIDPRSLALIGARTETSAPDSRLSSLHDEQLRAEEKLRNMEAAYLALEKRSAEFAQSVESGVVLAPRAESPVVAQPPESMVPPTVSAWESGKWEIYGALIGALAGLGGWLGWRAYRRRALPDSDDGALLVLSGSHAEPGGRDFPPGETRVDVPPAVEPPIDDREADAFVELPPVEPVFSSFDTTATLDEHFAASPVMELADIMLSFGRVKGAAQALQEFIDHNPQDALQPWIRLLDVYRMAGMRAEFDELARNLNRQFNVEVQKWDVPSQETGEAAPGELSLQATAGPKSLEEMPRLMNCVVDLWTSGDVVGYLYELLRDNRGGQRLGFSLPVVEDILFLIELKETVNRME